ncbi:hypothetical protein EG329_000055 [Mollisiaceae sp. DMI_Dod_QoI]|nr:hypothetical protein EG329_000055 [Helotiales sp. DMI_Dod_QoI]
MSGMPLGSELGIILGCLVAVAFVAGFVKLYINKKRLKANQQKADAEAAAKATDREKLVGKGYFGGVAQTRPSSPAPSYKLAPNAKLVDWGQVNKLRSDSASVASSSYDVFQDRNSSTSSLPTASSTIKKPSPLRLQPSGAEFNGKNSHNMSSVGGVGGNFLPPVPPPRSIRAPSPLLNEEKGSNWVSPLDVHFSRPSTPSRPTSFLPKLGLPLDFGNSDLSLPIPDSNGPKSETASIINTVVTMPPPIAQQWRPKTPKEIYAEFSKQGFAQSPTLETFSGQETLAKSPTFSKEEAPKTKSPTFSVFPQQTQATQQAPPRPNRLSMKSMFSTEEAPIRTPKEDFSRTFQLPPVPLDDLAPRLQTINPDRFPQDLKVWTPTSPIRDSILNRQRQPVLAGAPHSQEWSLPSPTLPDSMIDAQWQPSSNAVVRASIVSKRRVSVVQGPGAQSQDVDVQFARMRSRGHSMAASIALETLFAKAARHSQNPSDPQILIDEAETGITCILIPPLTVEIAVDQFKAAPSISINRERKPILAHDHSSALLPPAPTRFQPQDPERLSITPQMRGRSGSEVSQNSISDFYDSYYRQSTMGSNGQPTAIPMGPASRTSVSDKAQAFEDRARGRSGSIGARRPGPLKVGTGVNSRYENFLAGSGYGGFTPIVEVASPMPSPLVMGRDEHRERFPQMI